MKKILQINTVVNSGSTGRITEEIGQLAIKAGWKSYIAYGRNKRPSESELIKIGNSWDNKMHGLQTRLFDMHGLASKNATNDLVIQIKKIKPDIIHLHNIHGYYLNYEILFSFLNVVNIPVVWTLRYALQYLLFLCALC
jgi:putative colanic acid biosynthesis glycosyltransferase